MEALIKERLEQLALDEQIRIFWAVESGSRAWGFSSADSDYDVRFLYAFSHERYLSLRSPKDNLTYPVDDLLDFSGWDVFKAFHLLAKSNAPLIEWLHSPVRYSINSSLEDSLLQLAAQAYSPVAVFHHYWGMCKKGNGLLEEETPRGKSFFYLLRAVLCANWAVSQARRVPPVDIKGLFPLIPKATLLEEISELIAEKAEGTEKQGLTISAELRSFMRSELSKLPERGKGLSSGQLDYDLADHLIRKITGVEA